MPWSFKENGDVTLLGKASGGGSCVVLSLSTAWGTYLGNMVPYSAGWSPAGSSSAGIYSARYAPRIAWGQETASRIM